MQESKEKKEMLKGPALSKFSFAKPNFGHTNINPKFNFKPVASRTGVRGNKGG